MRKGKGTTFSFSPKIFCQPPPNKTFGMNSITVSKTAALHVLRSPETKQNLTPTDLVQPIHLAIFPRIVLTAAGCSSAPYLLTFQAEKVGPDSALRSHRSITLYSQKQNLTLTDFAHPTPLLISLSAVPTAFYGSSASYLCIGQTE